MITLAFGGVKLLNSVGRLITYSDRKFHDDTTLHCPALLWRRTAKHRRHLVTFLGKYDMNQMSLDLGAAGLRMFTWIMYASQCIKPTDNWTGSNNSSMSVRVGG